VNNWFINNREFIKGLAFNTGTSSSPTFTEACTSSEISLETDWEEKTFYVWCDAIQRTILTGGTLTISGTMKLDLNNTANMTLLSKIHSFITNGEISQFRDVIQFELLSGVSNSTMTYTKYQAPVVIKLSDLGGNAEDEAEFSYEISLQGKGTVVTSS
jgi:hypothetical protein